MDLDIVLTGSNVEGSVVRRNCLYLFGISRSVSFSRINSLRHNLVIQK